MTGDGRLDGPSAILGPRSCLRLVRCLDALEKLEKTTLNAELRNIRNLLLSVARANCGTPEPLDVADPSSSIRDPITVTAAAELLGCTREYAGRLALRGELGPTELRSGTRFVSRLEVADAAQDTPSKGTHQP